MRASLRRPGRAAFLASLLVLGSLNGTSTPPTLVDRLGRLALRRPFRARLSITTTYQPCLRDTVPGVCAGDDLPPRELVEISAEAAAELEERMTPEALHAAALAKLAAGAPGKTIDESIQLLTSSAVLRPSARVLSDLSAALLVRAERNDDARAGAQAIERAEQAMELDPADPAVLFDRALALEWWGLRHAARDAWNDYLRVDPTSEWAMEAREHAGRMATEPAAPPRRPRDGSARAARDFARAAPQQAREYGWDTALAGWARAVLRGNAAVARDDLVSAERVGDALVALHRDASLHDAVVDIRAAEGNAGATRTLARAVAALSRAAFEIEKERPARAAKAVASLGHGAIPSPALTLWVTLTAVQTGVLTGDTSVRAAGRRLVAEADSTRYPVLAARARWVMSTDRVRDQKGEEALALARAAEALLRGVGEHSLESGAIVNEADAEFVLGSLPESYRRARRAAALADSSHAPEWQSSALASAARTAGAEDLPRAAVRFNDERVAIARRMRSGSRAAQALLARAQRYEALGRVALARRDANAAADTFSDSVARAWIDAERHIARGRETIVSSPAQAIAEFDAVLRNRTGRATGYRVVQALLGRADARLAADDVRRAEVDLDSAAGWITRADAEIRRAGYRTSLLETARGLFDRLVMLRLAQGDTAGALCYLERGRVSFAPRRPEATQRPQCAWAVPAGTVALDYAQIGDTLLAWALRPNGVRLVRQTVPAAELAAIGEKARLRLEQRQDAARIRPLLAWLFNRLVKPLDGSLGPRGTRLAVVADGAVPADLFHALFDASRGRYVVEDYVVADVPALRDVHADRSRRRSNGPVLVAADPAFDRAAYPGLDDLPGAEAEADSVERLYGGSVVTMRGAAVTPSAFATALSRASIVHFAGHAEFDDQQPDASVLVLARDGRRRGTLSAAELAGKDLRGVRLVVLSACETLRSGTGRAGGFAGFTQALLGAGVGGVVGGSWKVDDALSRDLMIRFHREYRRTGDAAAALRQAQLELLRSGDPAQATPSTWAAFRYAGN